MGEAAKLVSLSLSSMFRRNNNNKIPNIDKKPTLFTSKNRKRVRLSTAASSGVVGSHVWAPPHSNKLAAVRRNSMAANSSIRNQKDSPQDARFHQEAATTTTTRRRSLQHANGRRARGQLFTPAPYLAHFDCLALVLLVSAGLLLAGGGNIPLQALATDGSNNAANQGQALAADNKAALEAELNAILQQQEPSTDTNSKLLSEAIISRLMLGNLTDIGTMVQEDGGANEPSSFDGSSVGETGPAADGNGPDAMRLRRIINYLQNYELANAGQGAVQALSQFPVLPVNQAATIKRASMKMSNYLRQQAQQQHGGQRQVSGYRNNYDFGLGKRPDSSVSGNILRFGDSASAGGHMSAVSGSGLGKRPSAHRYDFGLGKRVASVSLRCHF